MLIIPERPVDILWQSSVADIAPATQYGHKSDAVSINTDLCLLNRGSEDLSLPISFLTSDPDENRAPAPSVRIKKEVRLPEMVEMNTQKLEEAVAALATQQGQDPQLAKDYIRAVIVKTARRHKTYITVKAGQKFYIRVYQRQRLYSNPEGIFEFSTVAPLPQFVLVQGGSVHILALLPRPVDGFNVQLVEFTQGFNVQTPVVNERQIICWKWQNDPLLMVRYRY